MIWILAYLLAGGIVGFLAGLLGIGGGMTLVPIIAALLTAQQLAPEHTVHLALGTAMASVLFTSSASVRVHHQHGAVDWTTVKAMAPGLISGSLISTLGSGLVPQRVLAIAYAVIVFVSATQMLIGRKPSGKAGLPAGIKLFSVGLIIGAISGLVSAGGTFLTVPFMLSCGITMHTAIGTAAAMGLPLALVGTVGFVISGMQVTGLPPYSLGFVLLPALAALVAASIFSAPVGARLAHRLPVTTLRRVFAVLLYVLATKMAVTYW